MQRVAAITGEAEGGEAAGDSLVLDFDHRNRRRIALTTLAGARVLLDEPHAVHLRGGDVLVLEDGSRVTVRAADEALVEITAGDAAGLVRLAWHLGNRHLPTQLLPGPNGGAIRIRADHVIEAMVVGLGGRCNPINAPFDPEGGAYAGGGHGHHGNDHG